MTDPNRRREFRETIEQLVLDGDANKDTAIFDNNGFVIRTEDIADSDWPVFIKKCAISDPLPTVIESLWIFYHHAR